MPVTLERLRARSAFRGDLQRLFPPAPSLSTLVLENLLGRFALLPDCEAGTLRETRLAATTSDVSRPFKANLEPR